MAERIEIPARFRGPPASANGGYACGVLARRIGESAEVNLRKPPPLDKSLRLETEALTARLLDGEDLVAEGWPAQLDSTVPEPPTVAQARAALDNYIGFQEHPFPTCFVCGPDREDHDGLRIFPGRVEGREIVASPWTPDSSLPTDDGHVTSEVVWGALDCPTGFACELFGTGDPAVLVRLKGRVLGRVEIGRDHVAIGWPITRDGRKREGGSALFTETGELVAFAHGLWVELKR